MFGTVLISITTFMHIYVFWRVFSVPFIKQHMSKKILISLGILLWTIFYLGRIVGHNGTGVLAMTLEFVGMNWMGVLFLIFIPLVIIDLVTVWGLFMPKISSTLREWALIVGVLLAVFALFQGLRSPVINEYEVSLAGLPDSMEGTVLVVLSDMHLGSILGEGWLKARIAQVKACEPDIILLLGDIFEGHGPPEDNLIAAFNVLSAPLGVWAVTGNHEFHGRDRINLLERSGFSLLNNKWIEVKPGFILSGLDDLTAWRRNEQSGDPISHALINRPIGATIFLSHTPWEAERVSKTGVGLMLSGHTHGGQIWPFDYLVRKRYPLLEGRYEVGGMTVLVSRGTGTWGPRMRLWCPSEILSVTLRGKNNETS
jgi:predicted MPP superfamily phosphohydrolase